MPREIEEIQEDIIKNIGAIGLQLPFNLKNPFLAADATITSELYISQISTEFFACGGDNFEQSLENLVFQDSNCGVWPVIAERPFRCKEVTSAEINARLTNGLVFIVDVETQEDEIFISTCYNPLSLDKPIPMNNIKAILTPAHLVKTVKDYFPSTEIIPVGTIKHRANLEVSSIFSKQEYTGADFYTGLKNYISKNVKLTKKYAIHAVRLPTTFDLSHRPSMFDKPSAPISYFLPKDPLKYTAYVKVIQENGGSLNVHPMEPPTFTIQSDKLNKALRQQLDLDRLLVTLTSSQREKLKVFCTTSTIEPDLKRKGCFLITFAKQEGHLVRSILQEGKIVKAQAIYRNKYRLRAFFYQEDLAIDEMSLKIQEAIQQRNFKLVGRLSNKADELLTAHERLKAIAEDHNIKAFGK